MELVQSANQKEQTIFGTKGLGGETGGKETTGET